MYHPLTADCFLSTRPKSPPINCPTGPTDGSDLRIECPSPCLIANGLPNAAQHTFTLALIQKIKQRSDSGLSIFYNHLPEHEYRSIYDFAPQIPRRIILFAPHLQEPLFWPHAVCPTCSRSGTLRFENWKPKTHLAFDIDDCFYVLACSYKCSICRSGSSALNIFLHLLPAIQVALNRYIFIINKDTIVSAALYHLINLELTAHFNVNQLHGRLMRAYNATFIAHQSYHASLTAMKIQGLSKFSNNAATTPLSDTLLTSFDYHCGYNGRYLSCHRILEVYRHDHQRSDHIIRSLMSSIVDDTFKSDALASVAAHIGLRGQDVGSSNNQQPFNTLYVTATSTGLVADYHLLPTQDLTYQMACTFINIGPRLARLPPEQHTIPISWGFDTCCINNLTFQHFWNHFQLSNPFSLMGDGDHYLRRIIEKYASDAPHRNNFVHNLKLRMFGPPGSALQPGVQIAETIKTYAAQAQAFLSQHHPNRVSKEVWLAIDEQCKHFNKGCFIDPPLPFSIDRFGQIGLRRGTFALENIFFHLQKAAFHSFVSLDTALTFLAKFFFQWNLDRLAQYSKSAAYRAFPTSSAAIMAISVAAISEVRSCSLADSCKLSDFPVVAAMFDQSEPQQFGSAPPLTDALRTLSQTFIHPNPTKRIPAPPPITNSILEFIVEEAEAATTREHETFSQLTSIFDEVPLELLPPASSTTTPNQPLIDDPDIAQETSVSSDSEDEEDHEDTITGDSSHCHSKRRRRGDWKGTGKHKSKTHKIPPPQVSGTHGAEQRRERSEFAPILANTTRVLPCLPYGRDFFPIETHLLRYLAQRIRHVKPGAKGRGRNKSQEMTPDWQGIHRIYMYFAEWSFSPECQHPWIKRQIRGKTQDLLKQRYLLLNLNLEAFPGVPARSGPPLHPDPNAGLTPHQLMTHFSRLSSVFAENLISPPLETELLSTDRPLPSALPVSIANHPSTSASSPVETIPLRPLPTKKRSRFGTQSYEFLKQLDKSLPTSTIMLQWRELFPDDYRVWEEKCKAKPLKRKSPDDSLHHHFRALLQKISPTSVLLPSSSTIQLPSSSDQFNPADPVPLSLDSPPLIDTRSFPTSTKG